MRRLIAHINFFVTNPYAQKGGKTMSLNEGYKNEEYLINAINNKKYDELTPNLQRFIHMLFPNIDRNKKFKCFQAEEYTKPDIVICYGEKSFYVSVKHGTAENVHEEKIDSFIEFLKENGIDNFTIESYKLFQYGDGTTDGTGEKRMSNFEVRVKYDERIRAMNQKFNESKVFVKAFAERVVFQGVNQLAVPASILYHGDEDQGSFISKNQLLRHIELRRWDYMESVVHIGPFVLRPKGRYPDKEVKYPEFRHRVVVSYPRLLGDILYIFSKYRF